MFYSGLILFFGVHLIPFFSRFRSRLAAEIGENAYKAVFSLISLAGFLLIIFGYQSGDDFLYQANDFTYSYSQYIMLIAFVFLIASALPESYIKKFSRHPMSIGIALWAGVHLLTNPDFNSVILFGVFLIYAIASALWAEIRKKEVLRAAPRLQFDALAILLGAVLAYLAFHYHVYLSGVSL